MSSRFAIEDSTPPQNERIGLRTRDGRRSTAIKFRSVDGMKSTPQFPVLRWSGLIHVVVPVFYGPGFLARDRIVPKRGTIRTGISSSTPPGVPDGLWSTSAHTPLYPSFGSWRVQTCSVTFIPSVVSRLDTHRDRLMISFLVPVAGIFRYLVFQTLWRLIDGPHRDLTGDSGPRDITLWASKGRYQRLTLQ